MMHIIVEAQYILYLPVFDTTAWLHNFKLCCNISTGSLSDVIQVDHWSVPYELSNIVGDVKSVDLWLDRKGLTDDHRIRGLLEESEREAASVGFVKRRRR